MNRSFGKYIKGVFKMNSSSLNKIKKNRIKRYLKYKKCFSSNKYLQSKNVNIETISNQSNVALCTSNINDPLIKSYSEECGLTFALSQEAGCNAFFVYGGNKQSRADYYNNEMDKYTY